MNDRLTLDNAQQKNNSGSKKSKLAKLKQEALAKIDSVVAVVEKFNTFWLLWYCHHSETNSCITTIWLTSLSSE